MGGARRRKARRTPFVAAGIVGLVSLGAICAVPLFGAQDRVRDTKFKYRRGFYSAPFVQVIRSRTPGAKVRYTLDGTKPSETHGLGDTNVVAVPVETTTTLRAMAYKEGMLSTNVDTQTYIFLEDVLRQPAEVEGYPRPAIWEGSGFMTLDYEMDPEIVNHPAYRGEILAGLKSIPTLSLVMDKEDLFGERFRPGSQHLDLSTSGVYYGRPGSGPTKAASVELIYPEEPDKGFQIDCAVEANGTHGVKRALRLEFKSEYGPGKLRSTFLREAPLNGESATTTFDRLVLRSGSTRSWTNKNPDRTAFTRDQWIRDTQIAMSGIGSHGTFVHLYLNGLYWGLYNVAERPDAWFTSSYLGGEPEDWYAVNHRGSISGHEGRWLYLRGKLKNKDLRVLANYLELQEYLDVSAFADYMILAWYTRLDDWGPDRNWYGGNRNHPPSPLQFYMWDAEHSLFGGAGTPARVHPLYRRSAATDSWDMVGIWHSLVRSPDFMALFADRLYRHCFHGGALTEENAIGRWRRLNDHIRSAVIGESARWGDARESLGEATRTRDDSYLPEVERVVGLLTGNVPEFLRVLRDEGYYPSVDPPEIPADAGPDGRIRLVNPNPSGEVLFTLDGSDPRAAGGGVSPSARRAQTGHLQELGRGALLGMRVKNGDEWSALRRYPK
jgi:hypothetical protein